MVAINRPAAERKVDAERQVSGRSADVAGQPRATLIRVHAVAPGADGSFGDAGVLLIVSLLSECEPAVQLMNLATMATSEEAAAQRDQREST